MQLSTFATVSEQEQTGGKRQHRAGVLVEDQGAGDRRLGAPLPILRLSQRLWLRPRLNPRQRVATDLGLKTPHPLIDRKQFDDRAPRVDKILKRGSDLREGVQDLVHRTECDLASNDRWSEQDVGKDDVGLQINDAADIEVHEVQVKPEVVPANGTEQLAHGRWINAGRIIFAEHELLAT